MGSALIYPPGDDEEESVYDEMSNDTGDGIFGRIVRWFLKLANFGARTIVASDKQCGYNFVGAAWNRLVPDDDDESLFSEGSSDSDCGYWVFAGVRDIDFPEGVDIAGNNDTESMKTLRRVPSEVSWYCEACLGSGLTEGQN